MNLQSTDAAARFTPRSFIVNFGKVVGQPVFSVSFSTVGLHTVSATITSNMGSPLLTGRFVGQDNSFQVVEP